MHKSLIELKQKYTSIFNLDDDTIIDLLLAITIGSRIKNSPAVWLMLVGAPSSGKTQLISILYDIAFAHVVSDLTENTFLSGAPDKQGESMSLLHEIGSHGLLLMKDYTTILTMKKDKRDNIVAQLREIYDGYLSKKTGAKKIKPWEGKINFIGGVTQAIYEKENDAGAMGHRAVYYALPELTTDQRKNKTRNLLKSKINENELMQEVKLLALECVSHYHSIPIGDYEIPEDVLENIISLTEIVTRARTPVSVNYKDEICFVYEPEMPMRMARQIVEIARLFMFIMENNQEENKGILSLKHEKMLYRLCLDSVPKDGKNVLALLVEYPQGVTAKGIAHRCNMPTAWAKKELARLNAVKLCKRISEGTYSMDYFVLDNEYSVILSRIMEIQTKEGQLTWDDDKESSFTDKIFSDDNRVYSSDIDDEILKAEERRADLALGFIDVNDL